VRDKESIFAVVLQRVQSGLVVSNLLRCQTTIFLAYTFAGLGTDDGVVVDIHVLYIQASDYLHSTVLVRDSFKSRELN